MHKWCDMVCCVLLCRGHRMHATGKSSKAFGVLHVNACCLHTKILTSQQNTLSAKRAVRAVPATLAGPAEPGLPLDASAKSRHQGRSELAQRPGLQTLHGGLECFLFTLFYKHHTTSRTARLGTINHQGFAHCHVCCLNIAWVVARRAVLAGWRDGLACKSTTAMRLT